MNKYATLICYNIGTYTYRIKVFTFCDDEMARAGQNFDFSGPLVAPVHPWPWSNHIQQKIFVIL